MKCRTLYISLCVFVYICVCYCSPSGLSSPIPLSVGAKQPTDVLDMPVDPNEPTYCFCHQVSYGEMIGCDNQDVSLTHPYLYMPHCAQWFCWSNLISCLFSYYEPYFDMLSPPMDSSTIIGRVPVFPRLEFQALHNLPARAQKGAVQSTSAIKHALSLYYACNSGKSVWILQTMSAW